MKELYFTFLILAAAFVPGNTIAQQFQNRGWVYLSNTTKISGPVSLFTELQLRSADKLSYLNTTLVRGGLDYEIVRDRHKAGIGYVFKGDKENASSSDMFEYTRENRIYEQYIFSTASKLGKLQFRGRLEQRFIEQEKESRIFSQRVRLFMSTQIPLNGQADFKRGWFVIAQEELMITLQNDEQLSGGLFDQNRLYASLGYRFNEKIDLECGYLYWLQQELKAFDHKNVYQFKITTDL